MIEVKNNFNGGLDLDTSYYELNRASYVDALNITRDAISASQDRIVSNIVSNRLVFYDYTTDGNVIGAAPNIIRNTVIFMRYSATGENGIYEFNKTTRVITKIFECLTDSATDILNFTFAGKITSINIFNRDEGDLLFFIDSLGRPTYLNITSFKAGLYTPVTRNILDTAFDWPSDEPDCVYGNDATKSANYLTNKLFRFQQIWVGDDLQQTICSPVSEVPLPVNILDPTYTNVVTNNNVISISLDSGGKNVKAIKLLMSYVEKSNNWSDFQEVITIDKATEGLADDTPFNYQFYNDSTYPVYNPVRRIMTQDWVPRFAKSQEMPNGNVLALAGITEGYDNNLEPNVTITINTIATGSTTPIGSLSGTVTLIAIKTYRDDFLGIPATGTVVQQFVLVGGVTNTLVGTYTTLAGDTTTEVAAGLAASMLGLGIVVLPSATANRVTYTISLADTIGSLVITPPTGTTASNSISTWPFSTQRNIGLIYFDEKGRTNGVVYNSQIIFPKYNENGSQEILLPYINAKIYHVPPDWAYSYSWVMSKEDTQYLYLESIDVNTNESDFLYFDITNLGLNAIKNPTTEAVVSWTFQDGDKMRLIKRVIDGFIFSSLFDIAVEGIVTDPSINGTTQTGKTFIKIRRTSPFSAQSYASKFFIIQLYRPQQQQASKENLVYYEFGQSYPIFNPTTATRIHAGMVTDQSTDYITPAEFNFYSGDSYYRLRTEYLSGSINTPGYGTFNIQDRNFVDFYISAVNSIDGRPFVIDSNAKETFFPASLRFSQEYQSNTNINGLNQFYSADLEDYDYSYGIIERLKVRDRVMKIFQTNKVGRVYIFNQISKDNIGNQVLVQTDKLLNPIQYDVGDWGIGTASTSLASFNFADYFCDNIRGAICRSSTDGTLPISILYKVNSWATEQLPLRTGNFHIYGAYDQKLNNYIIALEETGTEGIKGIGYLDCSGSFQEQLIAPGGTVSICAREGSVIIASGITLEFDPDYNCGGGNNCKRYIASYPILSPITLTFSEGGDTDQKPTFESFVSVFPEMMCTLGTLLIAFKDGELWTHDDSTYNNFFGVQYESSITAVFNQNPLEKKTWQSVTEAANKLWDCPEITTQVESYDGTQQLSKLVSQHFVKLESQFHAAFRRDMNSRGGLINGQILKGNWMKIKFRREDASTFTTLNIVSVKTVDSPLTNK